MAILVIAEHDNATLKLDTAKVVACAQAIGSEVDVLVAGHNCGAAADSAKQLAGVRQVLVADSGVYANAIAENLSQLIVSVASEYQHILAAASSVGKDVLPRVAALLDVAQLSEVVEVVSEDTFVRPIYAGSAMATVQSLDNIKVMTVRASAFDAVAQDGSASVQTLDNEYSGDVEFVTQTLSV